jgi:hypothetical protein
MATRPILQRLIGRQRLMAISAFAVGCAGSDPNPQAEPASTAPRVFVGEVPGTDARVGIVASSAHARFFFCGGPSSYLTLTHWLPADLTPAGDASADVGGFRLDAMLEGKNARGTIVEADGSSHPFAAVAITPATVAGLYEAASPCGKVGLIVSQTSAAAPAEGQGACVSGAGQTPGIRQVNPILPLARDASGTIRVVVDGSGEEAQVRAAAP